MKSIVKDLLSWADDRTQVIAAMVIIFAMVFAAGEIDPAKEKIALSIVSGLFGIVTGYSVGKMNGNGKTGDSEKPPVDVEPSPPIG